MNESGDNLTDFGRFFPNRLKVYAITSTFPDSLNHNLSSSCITKFPYKSKASMLDRTLFLSASSNVKSSLLISPAPESE